MMSIIHGSLCRAAAGKGGSGMQFFGAVLQLNAPRVFLTSNRFSSVKKTP